MIGMGQSREDVLLKCLLNGEECSPDTIDEFVSALRGGYPLRAVEKLVESPNRTAHSVGLYIIKELSSHALPLKELVIDLGKNGYGYDKFIFAEFCIATRLQDYRLPKIFVKFLNDFDLILRAKAVMWAISSNDEDFSKLTECMDTSSGVQKKHKDKLYHVQQERKERAFGIAKEIRQYKLKKDFVCIIESLKERYPREDEITFEYLLIYKNKILQ
ncbi:hypothetical protein SH611_16150 [Geminicoccaceae bacterium 1502E]|nr:hypothetical protein [Geminicoccaceae bacterium 1502E]